MPKLSLADRFALSFLAFLCCLLMSPEAMADMKISPVETWSTVFGEQATIRHFKISTARSFTGRVEWRITAGGATISRGEQHLVLNQGHPEILQVTATPPKVKPGISGEMVISIWAIEKDDSPPLAHIEKKISIFSPEILVDDLQQIKGANIHLFDPKKETAEIFRQAKIPFTLVRNIETITELKGGILVLGEGLSWKGYRGLASLLIEVVASGTSVLCLAPQDGSLPLPIIGGNEDENNINVVAIDFRKENIINELHHKLDSHTWSPDKTSIRSSFFAQSQGNKLALHISNDSHGWPWLEIRFQKPDTILLFCGFGIIENWDANPTPRHLLEKIFLHILKYEKSINKELQ